MTGSSISQTLTMQIDIALASTLLKDAQDLLTSVENASAKVGIFSMLGKQNTCQYMKKLTIFSFSPMTALN